MDVSKSSDRHQKAFVSKLKLDASALYSGAGVVALAGGAALFHPGLGLILLGAALLFIGVVGSGPARPGT